MRFYEVDKSCLGASTGALRGGEGAHPPLGSPLLKGSRRLGPCAKLLGSSGKADLGQEEPGRGTNDSLSHILQGNAVFKKKKKYLARLNFRASLLPLLGTVPDSSRSTAREGSWRTQRQLLPSSPVLLSTWDAAGQAAELAHGPEPRARPLRRGHAWPNKRITSERACGMLNLGLSGLSSAFAEIPSKESRLLPFPHKLAVAGNPQKSARKGQGAAGA
nr:uncharacterized protein LOC111770363 [Equus caballus]